MPFVHNQVYATFLSIGTAWNMTNTCLWVWDQMAVPRNNHNQELTAGCLENKTILAELDARPLYAMQEAAAC